MRIGGAIGLAALITTAAALAAVSFGAAFINPFDPDPLSREILLTVRLPRVCLALIAGAALGSSGAVLQGMLRNPLADPYILGISSGAALGAAGSLVIGIAPLGGLTTTAFAFLGAIVTSLIVGALGYKKGSLVPERLLLAGIGLGFFFTAALMVAMSVSADYDLRRALLWVFGDLSLADWSLVPLGAVLVGAGLIASISRARGLNALTLGDELAHSLGFTPSKERLILFAAVSLMTAAAVALAGIIGFVGLLIPHIVRFTFGADSRVVVPVSALIGAAMLAFSDMIGRAVISPAELPSGIVTALIGAPYFLYLLARKGGRGPWQ